MLRFRLFNVPFEIGIDFWIGSALLGGNMATGPNAVALLLLWIACVLVSIVVHELGHALAARRFGVQPTVQLHVIGGVTRMYGRLLTRSEGFWVTLCGPAAGLGLYLAAFAVDRWYYPAASIYALFSSRMTPALAAGAVLNFLLWINLVWTVFNLLPILPLDGGQLLRSILGPRYLKVTEGVSVFVAGVAATLLALHGRWYPAIFLGYLAILNLQGNPRALAGGTTQAAKPER